MVTTCLPTCQSHPLTCGCIHQVDISLNGTTVTTGNDTYAYWAYLETLLSYGDDAKHSQLTAALYRKDTAKKYDSLELYGNDANNGFIWRNDHVKQSHSVDMMGCIHADLFFQNRYILNKVNIKIKLVRSHDQFCLMGNQQYKVLIKSAILYIRKVKLSSSVFWLMLKHWNREVPSIRRDK